MKDQAPKLDLRLIDALVAEKVMGWPPAEGDYPAIPSFSNFSGSESVEVAVSHITAGDWISRKWTPSTDVAAAFEVVEKLRQTEWLFDLNLQGRYTAIFRREYLNSSPRHTSKEDTAPLAICLAALKAVGYELVR